MTSIGFIGGGKMAEAIIKGLISSKSFALPEICVSEPDPERKKYLEEQYRISVTDNNREVIALSDIIILAVKPQVLTKVLPEITPRAGQLLISIAAGITLSYMEKRLPNASIVRAMPNNPALVGAGITALAVGGKVKKEQLEEARKIFAAIGQVVEVEEKFMDAVTGLSGSGPAYVYLMIEALTEAGKKLGIDQKSAEKLAVETVLGAAKTTKETGKPASELREMVTSPGGTTIEGLKVLEKRKFAETVVEAVKAAAEKSKKLSQ